MANPYSDDNEIVTIYSRSFFTPSLTDSQRLDMGNIPEIIYFGLPDGSELAIKSHEEIIIGRQARPEDPPVTIDLESQSGHKLGVSRHHAMIKLINGKLLLIDLDSINGTFVNGHRALPIKRYAISDGDTITIGKVEMELRFRPSKK